MATQMKGLETLVGAEIPCWETMTAEQWPFLVYLVAKSTGPSCSYQRRIHSLNADGSPSRFFGCQCKRADSSSLSPACAQKKDGRIAEQVSTPSYANSTLTPWLPFCSNHRWRKRGAADLSQNQDPTRRGLFFLRDHKIP